jgi:hypothetical protein
MPTVIGPVVGVVENTIARPDDGMAIVVGTPDGAQRLVDLGPRPTASNDGRREAA